MKRAFLALCLAGLGLLESGCCSCCQKYDDPQFNPEACGSQGGCGCGHCSNNSCGTGWHPFRNLFSCNNGCGARYFGDWFTLQAPCCSTCDKCGNYYGRGAGAPSLGNGPAYSQGPMVSDGVPDGTDTIVEDGAPQYMPTPAGSGARPRRATTTQ
jgi:hypothetical protein